MKMVLIMEAARTSETSVNFYQTTRRNNPENIHLDACRLSQIIGYFTTQSQLPRICEDL
jgi:hypothetical protein